MDVDRVGRWGRGCLVIVLATATVVVAGQAPAQAEPQPGAVTATFTDICGFIQAEFTNSDPIVAAQIRSLRNGTPLEHWSGFVGGAGSATLYQVATAADIVRFEWRVYGGATESLEHQHLTPSGCDEPSLSVSLIDDCGPEFTIKINNTGTAPADVLVNAPTLVLFPVTVPVGVFEVTVPGVAGSSAWVGRFRPGGTDPNADLAEVGSASRGSGCGIPWPDSPTGTFTPACDRVTIVFFAVGLKGQVNVYRNGQLALEGTVGGGIEKWMVPAARGDVMTIGEGPRLPAMCTIHPKAARSHLRLLPVRLPRQRHCRPRGRCCR
jgi:hypothetical protein